MKTVGWVMLGLVLGLAVAGGVGYSAWMQLDQSVKGLTLQNQKLQDKIAELQIPDPDLHPTPSPDHDIVWADSPTPFIVNDDIKPVIKTLPVVTEDDGPGPAYLNATETEAILIGTYTAGAEHQNWSIIRAHAYDAQFFTTEPVFKLFAVSPDKRSAVPLPDETLPKIENAKFPLELTLPNGKTVQRGADDIYSQVSCLNCVIGQGSNGPTVTTKEGITLFVSGISGIAYDPFGRGVTYSDTATYKGIGDITWTIPIPTTSTYVLYTLKPTGCGGGDLFVSDAELGSLKAVGTVLGGQSIYTPADLKNNDLVKARYDNWFPDYSTTTKPSLDEYIRRFPVPFFVRRNAFGVWETYASDKAGVIAECGKPVIYLYPEKTTKISVALPSFVNVTKSEPAYPAKGWNVIAQPNGTLTYNGSKYDSLFWEGTGVGYETPKQGFIVKDGDVAGFLKTTLPKYGLNQKEIADFMEFWVPKFAGAPYYRISFLTTDWNKAAPLHVSPAPRTSIRLFMDWSKLSGPATIAAPQIVTPSRDGYTLVEWGGLLR